MGNFGIYEKPRKVRISHISNSAPTTAEFDQLLSNFKSTLPSKISLTKKHNFIQNLLSGKLSSHQLEEISWRSLEDKIAKGKPLNIPYERERLLAEIHSFESKIGKALTLNMKREGNSISDNATMQLKMRQKRLERILEKLDAIGKQDVHMEGEETE